MPGGEVEEDESIDVAVCREIEEEVGMLIDQGSVQLAHERVTPVGRRDTLFTAKLSSEKPTVTISWEHESYEWIPAEKVLEHLDTTDDYMIVAREYLS